MTLWIPFALCFVVQCFSTPLFLKLIWPTRSMKSLAAKMLSATMFLAVALLSVKISGNTSDFAKTMLLGIIFGWIGDFFLHSERQSFFVVGFFSFMAGHIAYITAYVRALNTFEGYNHFNFIEVSILVALLITSVYVFKKYKFEFSMKILKLGVMAYSAILCVMLLKATSLGVNFALSEGKYGILAAVVLSLGALLFMLSDGTIGILMFGGQKKNKPLKVFNIVTYFAGQMLLASSILFINI